MATASNIKRKNIDLQADALQKPSTKANAITVEVSENPSPSGDSWFNDPENMASVKRGIAEMKAGKGRAYTMDEIRELLG